MCAPGPECNSVNSRRSWGRLNRIKGLRPKNREPMSCRCSVAAAFCRADSELVKYFFMRRSPKSRAAHSAGTYRKPLRKSLERAARELKDSDEFVIHIGAISARYRAAHAQDSREGRAALKQSLRVFHKHAAALAQRFEQSERRSPATAEAQALQQLDEELQSTRGLTRLQTQVVREWLSHAERVADDWLRRSVRAPAEVRSAPPLTAEALLATFDHHKLKVALGSKRAPGPIVRLLCEIAKASGDDLSVEAAREALGEARSR